MRIRAFITHKKAELFKDCQDRFSINPDTKSVAVSDGMSQSYQQKPWADLLVKAYTENAQWEPNLKSVKELAPLWLERVKSFIQNLKDTNAPQYLIIRNENALALRKSAGATFCGIRFNGYKWSGYVLGDSCLIELEKNRIKKLYTSQNGDEFDNHPDFFDSNPFSDGKGTPLAIKGSIGRSTSIIMVSDPFSDFLLEKQKKGEEEKYIKELLAINNHDEFEKLVADWRDNRGMHNDDSTLIIIENDGRSSFDVVCQDKIDVYLAEEQKAAEEIKSAPEEKNEPDDAVSEEEVHQENQPSQSESNTPETINENEDSSIDLICHVPMEGFIQTGIGLYERIKAENEVVFVTPRMDEAGILKTTLEEIYNIYYLYFNK